MTAIMTIRTSPSKASKFKKTKSLWVQHALSLEVAMEEVRRQLRKNSSSNTVNQSKKSQLSQRVATSLKMMIIQQKSIMNMKQVWMSHSLRHSPQLKLLESLNSTALPTTSTITNRIATLRVHRSRRAYSQIRCQNSIARPILAELRRRRRRWWVYIVGSRMKVRTNLTQPLEAIHSKNSR